MAAATNTNPAATATGARAASVPAGGFTNLIDALLGPAPAGPQTAPSPAQVNVKPVSADNLADAMIRSMLTSSANLAAVNTPASATNLKKQPTQSQDPASVAAGQPAQVIPPAVMALTQSPLLRSPDTSGKGVPTKLPFGAIVLPADARNLTAPAPLAFGMRLTQTDAPVADAPAAQAPATPAAQPPQPESVAPLAAVPAPVETPSTPAPGDSQPEPSKPAASSASPADSRIQKESPAHADAAPAVTAAAAAGNSSDNAGDFARQLASVVVNVPAPAAKTAGVAAPVASQPARTAEPLAPAPQQPATPLKEIAVRIATPQAPAVDVHVTERAGQIHVAVRTADSGMQTSLRQELGTLVNSLERSGYRTEAFAPRDGTSSALALNNSQNSRQDSESGTGGRNGNSGDTSQNSGGGQQQQQRRSPRPSNWIEELENQQ